MLASNLLGDRPVPSSGSRLRIVSLSPNITEIVFALGAGQDLVGVTTACDYPPEARRLARAGGFGSPDAEAILALKPQLVVGSGPGMDVLPAVELLRRREVPVCILSEASFGDLFLAIRRLGDLTGRVEAAARLTASLSERLAAVERRFRDVPEGKRPRVYVEIWMQPLISVGASSFVTELVRRAGGISITADLPGDYPQVSPEVVVARDPSVIVLTHGGGSATAASVGRRVGWARVTAVREMRVIADLLPDLILRPGPRLVEGVEELSRRLYAEVAP